jgi:hypothetical protein
MRIKLMIASLPKIVVLLRLEIPLSILGVVGSNFGKNTDYSGSGFPGFVRPYLAKTENIASIRPQLIYCTQFSTDY